MLRKVLIVASLIGGLMICHWSKVKYTSTSVSPETSKSVLTLSSRRSDPDPDALDLIITSPFISTVAPDCTVT